MVETAIAYGIWAAAAAGTANTIVSAQDAKKGRRQSARAQSEVERRALTASRKDEQRLKKESTRQNDMSGIAAINKPKTGANPTTRTTPQGIGQTTTMGGGAA